MNKKNVTKNYIYNLLYQILLIILPIITTPYLSRVLGAESMGIYGYNISIVTYFTLIGALGLSVYGQREIAYVQEDRKKRSKIFCELAVLRIITVTLITILFFFIFCLQGDKTFYYRILILEIIATAFDISWLYQGLEDFKKVVIRNLIVKLISLILIFLLIKNPSDLWKYFCIYVSSTFLGNVTLWINIKKYIDIVKIKFTELKKHLLPTVSLFIPQIATSIYTVLDKTMLGTMVSDISEVGYYEQSQKIIKIALTVVTTMGVVMVPRVANTYASGNKEKIQLYMKKTFNFVWFFSLPIMFGIIAISNDFVPWFFGQGYDKVSILMPLSSSIIIFISLSTIIGQQFLLTTKRQNIRTVAIIIGAITNVILNFLLLKKYASIGAVISTVVAEFLICTIEIVYISKKNLINIQTIFYGFKKYMFVSILMFIIIYVIQNFMNASILSTIIQISVGMLIYGTILLIIKDKFIYNIIGKILNRKKD